MEENVWEERNKRFDNKAWHWPEEAWTQGKPSSVFYSQLDYHSLISLQDEIEKVKIRREARELEKIQEEEMRDQLKRDLDHQVRGFLVGFILTRLSG